jgi:hypothetical protein
MTVRVLDLRILPGDKPLKAFCDLEIGDWTIREFRIIKENGRPYRVALPQLSWKAPDGQILYKTLITLPDELKGQIDFTVLKRFTEEMEKMHGNLT